LAFAFDFGGVAKSHSRRVSVFRVFTQLGQERQICVDRAMSAVPPLATKTPCLRRAGLEEVQLKNEKLGPCTALYSARWHRYSVRLSSRRAMGKK
jgi:hypothetical protein